mgnify:CR=1 FL=1
MEDNVIIDPVVSDELPVSTLAPTDDIIPATSECPCDGGCEGTPAPVVPVTPENTISVGAFFGTIQESVTIVWRFHLKTKKYSVHKALNDFYNDALVIVDDIIEQYQGINGVVEEPFVNCVTGDDKTETLYLNALKDFVNANETVIGVADHSELKSTVDNFKALIDSTIYLITSFTEHKVKSYDEFCYENLNEECSCEHCDEDDEENAECSGEEEE